MPISTICLFGVRTDFVWERIVISTFKGIADQQLDGWGSASLELTKCVFFIGDSLLLVIHIPWNKIDNMA